MQRIAWKAHVSDITEYRRRHDEIWPEMTEMLNEAGIHNYSIWNVGNELFAYMECHIDWEESQRIQRESEVQKKWNKHMEDLLVLNECGQVENLEQVFFHN